LKLSAMIACWAAVSAAQPIPVRGTVTIAHAKLKGPADSSGTVVWLKPAEEGVRYQPPSPRPRFKIVQQNKRFDPRVLAVPMGSMVDFPNFDPFFHNVFSLFDGKRFDLGLYEAGASHAVNFDRAGLCYIFCNIHPEMSAVVIVVDTPYFAVSARSGEFTIAQVPAGRYYLHVWSERAKPVTPAEFPRAIGISAESATVAAIRLIDSGQLIAPHKNKYGRDYDAFGPPSPVYKH